MKRAIRLSIPALFGRAGLLWLLAFAGLSPTLLAQEHPNAARGFGRSAQHHLGVDSINPFNGNLTLTVPLASYPVGPSLSLQLAAYYNSEVWEQYDDGSGFTAIPNRTDNAGLGWRLSLGQLVAPYSSSEVDTSRWVWIGPDGARHTFYESLHEGEPIVADFLYTRDGSYLRLNKASRTVEFPDGVVHTFDAKGDPSRMADRFGNWIQVDYLRNAAGQHTRWTITDVHQRTNRVYFKTTGSAHQPPVVDRLDLVGPGGVLQRIWFHHSSDGGTLTQQAACYGNGTNLALSFLTAIELADGTRYSMPLSDYYLEPPPAGTTVCRAGRIARVTVPTKGKVEWDYGLYRFPDASTDRVSRRRSTGVGVRRLLDHNGIVAGTWTYTTTLNTANTELVNEMMEPTGVKTRSYFSVCASSCAPEERWYEYGLPFTRDRAGDGTGRFLATEVVSAAGAVLRTRYARYERDALPYLGEFEERNRLNQRLAASRTAHNDGTFADETLSGFDGHGHYRSRVFGGNFPGNDSRTEATGWKPGGGYSPGQTGYQIWPTTSPWILGVFNFTWSREGTAPLRYRSYCFEPTTGFLLGRRVHAASNNGAAYSANDLIEVFRRSTTVGSLGFVGEEYYLGGDVQAIPTDGSGYICTLAQTATFYTTAQYRVLNAYAAGNRTSSRYATPAGATVLEHFRQNVDPSTGLPTATFDVAGLRTDLSYDATGRLTQVQPSGDARTVISYRNAFVSGSTLVPARVTTGRYGASGGLLTESWQDFDAWGRPVTTGQQMPTGTSEAQTAYTVMGWRSYQSVLGATGYGTSYQLFDAFGRPGRIRPPDGSAHDVTLAYSGVQSVSRTTKVATGATGAETSVTTTEVYDRFGRLHEVVEPSNVVTRYEYDVDGNLTRVCQNATSTACGQERRFDYDPRGLLVSETHPEKVGAVRYRNYDARRNALRKIDGGPDNGPHDLTFTYDRAGRLTSIRETAGPARMLESYVYSPGNTTGDNSLGKVKNASRFNYQTIGGLGYTIEVIETHTYGGREGRVSRKNTQSVVNATPYESFVQSYTYDQLGNLDTLNYPECTFSWCQAPMPRTVSLGYSRGFLTSVNGFATISYHANGAYHQIVHSNGVTDTQERDPSWMSRPASLQAQKAGASTPLWTSGTYVYDGAGNVKRIGSGYFQYDALGRVVSGQVNDGATAAGNLRSQTYQYDVYGNLKLIGGDAWAPGRTIDVSSANNRLNGELYDDAGNQLTWGHALPATEKRYEYDGLGQMTRMAAGSEDWRYIYGPGGERFWAYRPTNGTSHWALRDLQGKVLREYRADGGNWTQFTDYVYRGGQLLAAIDSPGAVRHFSLDHLGTPRAITTAGNAEDSVWVEDGLPAGATPVPDSEPWAWVSASPPPFSGSLSHQSALLAGLHQHYFYGATSPMVVNAGDTLVAYVYLDPVNPPSEVMLQWNDGTWEHRAYWGANLIGWGVDGTASRRCMGALPAVGQWVRLEVAASAVGLEGRSVNGMAFTLYGGKATWDHAGKVQSGDAVLASYHAYFPFGEEIPSAAQHADQMKFTGHERDLANLDNVGDDLDYMHARLYSPLVGRFLSTDLIGGNQRVPQSWNRYTYVINNPVKWVDTTGLREEPAEGFIIGAGITVCTTVEGGPCIASQNDGLAPGSEASLASFWTFGYWLQRARAVYQRRFEENAAIGGFNLFGAAVDYGALLWLPESTGEAGGGVLLSLAFGPGGRFAGVGLLKGKNAVREAARRLGIDVKRASEALHKVKYGPAGAGRHGADDVWIDPKNGNIISPENGEVIGSLYD